jgi:glycyl-tRNA synthetase beta subunit
MYWKQTDVVQLRRQANANLVALRSGAIKRQREAEQERARTKKIWERQERADKAAAKKEAKGKIDKLNALLSEITPYWEELMVKHEEGTLDQSERGALEEVDHQRDTILEDINMLTDTLYPIWR